MFVEGNKEGPVLMGIVHGVRGPPGLVHLGDSKKSHCAAQNHVQFKMYGLFICETFHLIFSDCG